MDTVQEAQQALHEFVSRRQTVTVFPAQVKAVDGGDLTCDVEDSEGIEIFGVRLRASVDGSDEGFVIVPDVGSWVLVCNIGNSRGEFVVVATTESSKVALKIGSSRWLVDADGVATEKGMTKVSVETDGVLIERNSTSLKTLMEALIDQIKLITVTCAAPGAPSTPPLNLAAFDLIKTQIGQVLK